MTTTRIRPYIDRQRGATWPTLVAAAALLVIIAGAGLGADLAIQGRVAAARPIPGTVPLCPAASTERRP